MFYMHIWDCDTRMKKTIRDPVSGVRGQEIDKLSINQKADPYPQIPGPWYLAPGS